MKKVIVLLFVAVMALSVAPAQAQLRFGVKGGVNISSISFDSKVLDSDNITGFHVGPTIEAMIPFFGLGLDAAVLYTQKGASFNNEDIRTDYIDVPVNLKWKIGIPIVKAYLAAGPYIGFRVGGDKIWKVLDEQIEAKTFGMGLNFGAGVELFKHVQVGFNYGLGLTDNFSHKKDSGSSNSDGKNRGWAISAAIFF